MDVKSWSVTKVGVDENYEAVWTAVTAAQKVTEQSRGKGAEKGTQQQTAGGKGGNN